MRATKKITSGSAATSGRPRRFGRRLTHQLPPPDPSTRVELERPDPPAARRHGSSEVGTRQRGSAGLIIVAGLSGVMVATGSRFVEVIHLPSSSEVSVATFGVALVVLGLAQRSRRPATSPEVVDQAAAVAPVMPPDLPSLIGELAGVLAHLRRVYGLAYRTRTWLDDVLPSFGFTTAQPELVRDLLAVSALDAGAVRADVTALTEAHSTAAIVEAGSALLIALGNVRDACEQHDVGIGELPQSDPSSWPSNDDVIASRNGGWGRR